LAVWINPYNGQRYVAGLNAGYEALFRQVREIILADSGERYDRKPIILGGEKKLRVHGSSLLLKAVEDRFKVGVAGLRRDGQSSAVRRRMGRFGHVGSVW
jgi:hypothetical protein